MAPSQYSRTAYLLACSALTMIFACVGCSDDSPAIALQPVSSSAAEAPKPHSGSALPTLPITISDILALPNISMDEPHGIGPGFREWGLTTDGDFPYIHAEAYDKPGLTRLSISVYTDAKGSISDHTSLIHTTFCQLFPDDTWLRDGWPHEGVDGHSFPRSIVHDKMKLSWNFDKRWTVLEITGTQTKPEGGLTKP